MLWGDGGPEGRPWLAEESIKNFSSTRGRGIKIIEVIRLDPGMDPPVVTEMIHKVIKNTHARAGAAPANRIFRGHEEGQSRVCVWLLYR
jgi:hypothetical protein